MKKMKKILLLLLFTVASYGQAVFDEGIQIKNNTTDNSATKVNVQSTDGTINNIAKNDLIDVVEVNDVPSLPLVGNAGKIYVVKNLNKIYRWNSTFYQELAVTDISGLQAQLNLKANDSDVVKLTGNQTISGQKSFSLTGKIDMQTNNAFPAISVTSLGSINGQSAAEFINNSSSTYSSALRLRTSSSGGVGNMALNVSNQSPIGTGIFSNATNTGVSISSESLNGDSYISNITLGGTGRNYVGRNNGTETYSVDKTGNVLGNSYIKRSTPANNILLAGGGDLAQGTAFNKNFGLNTGDVVGANTLLNQYSTTPIDWTATTFDSGQVVFYGGKQWIAKIATVAGDVPAVSPKWEEITFESLANKTTTVDQTIIDGSTNAVSGNAVFDGLEGKSPIVHTHTVSQITDFPTFKTIEGQSVIGAGNIDLDKNSVGLGNVDNTSDINKPISTATQTALNLKAPLASPSLTGTPTAPTATAGTNTTRIATTAFVTGAISTADSGNVKLTGNQTITGTKTFNNPTASASITTDNSSIGYGVSSLNSNGGIGVLSQNTGTGQGIRSNNSSSGVGIVSNQTPTGTGFNYVGQNNGTNTFTVDKFGATTATSFIKSLAPTTNILLAGGGDIAQNTAFNKNFGTTAGTVVEGGTLGSNAYSSTAYLPLTGGTLTGILNIGGVDSPKIFFQQNSSLISLVTNNFGIYGTGSKTDFNTFVYGNNPYGIWTNGVKRVSVGGDGSTTFSGTVTATSYTATSLPVFENNAAASSLAVGQFYRTSIGVLMVKF